MPHSQRNSDWPNIDSCRARVGREEAHPAPQGCSPRVGSTEAQPGPLCSQRSAAAQQQRPARHTGLLAGRSWVLPGKHKNPCKATGTTKNLMSSMAEKGTS